MVVIESKIKWLFFRLLKIFNLYREKINKIMILLQIDFRLNIENSLFKTEFFNIFCFLIIAIIVVFIIITFSYLLAKQLPETEKLSAYECGFEPYENARRTFDVKFYLVALLFIIFDIETMFLFPWCISLSQLSSLGFWSMIDFIIELGIGFVYVWAMGALDWE